MLRFSISDTGFDLKIAHVFIALFSVSLSFLALPVCVPCPRREINVSRVYAKSYFIRAFSIPDYT
jgi:hypothetical protein